MVALLSADGRILYASPAVETILGVDPETVTHTSIYELMHPGDREGVLEILSWLADEPDRSAKVEVRLPDGGGGWREVHAVARNLLEDPAVAGVVLTGRDMTRHVRLEAHLHQTQKMEALGTFTAGIAHDFNNLLAIILSNAESLIEEAPEPPPGMREQIQDIRDTAEKGAELIRRLLAFSRKGDLQIERLDLAATLTALESPLQRLLTPRVQVQISIEENLPHVSSDTTAIQQIVLNLATNARDAIPDRGSLKIRARSTTLMPEDRSEFPWVVPGGYVRLSVEDTGVGMDQETLERIFEPLFTTKERGEGTGLGLAVVHGLVKQQGGLVHAYSEPGEGTVFNIYLPVASEVTSGPEGESGKDKMSELAASARRHDTRDPDDEDVPGGSDTILVIEDEEALRRSADRVLTRLGYRVLTAATGEEGLELYRSRPHQIDLVLSDDLMPGMSGTDVLRALADSSSEVPFILMSGYSRGKGVADDEGEDGRGEIRSETLFLQKPWSIGDLAVAIRQALDEQTARS